MTEHIFFFWFMLSSSLNSDYEHTFRMILFFYLHLQSLIFKKIIQESFVLFSRFFHLILFCVSIFREPFLFLFFFACSSFLMSNMVMIFYCLSIYFSFFQIQFKFQWIKKIEKISLSLCCDFDYSFLTLFRYFNYDVSEIKSKESILLLMLWHINNIKKGNVD